jgi:hypothetical protein
LSGENTGQECEQSDSAEIVEARFVQMKKQEGGEVMKRAFVWCLIVGALMCIAIITGCKKRYFPMIQEEVIDEGVPIYQETVVE